jgi:hypothetical protein
MPPPLGQARAAPCSPLVILPCLHTAATPAIPSSPTSAAVALLLGQNDGGRQAVDSGHGSGEMRARHTAVTPPPLTPTFQGAADLGHQGRFPPVNTLNTAGQPWRPHLPPTHGTGGGGAIRVLPRHPDSEPFTVGAGEGKWVQEASVTPPPAPLKPLQPLPPVGHSGW